MRDCQGDEDERLSDLRVGKLEAHAEFMGQKRANLIQKRAHILAKIDAAWKSLGSTVRTT